tara:strand:+ start:2361 stop:3968 length:1608 start_codon:yes stop_codon:yes gene_type:complete
MELIVSCATGKGIVQDYLDRSPKALPFYGRHYAEEGVFEDKALELDLRFDQDSRRRAADALVVPVGADRSRLEAFVEDGGFMVTTGQQPGLYGGPLYSIYKGLTAVRVAEAAEAKLGKPVIPVFWVASDDHDWEEANHSYLINTENELCRFEVRGSKDQGRQSLHRIRLGEEADRVLDDFVASLPITEFTEELVSLLRAGFSSGSSIPQGFHDLLQHLLGRFGLFFTDATDLTIKAASRDLVREELATSGTMEDVLRGTADALESAGYGLQAAIMPEGVNLFVEGAHGRERLYRDPAGFRLNPSQEVRSATDVHASFDSDPASVSPNVLFRPIVESHVFPTLAYVAGPGEIGYYAQLSDYFKAHNIEMPIVWPRFSVATIEKKVGKVLKKFDVTLDDLQRPFHEIASGFAHDEIPIESKEAIGKLRASISEGVSELQVTVSAVDPTLRAPAEQFRNQAFGTLKDLESKLAQAVKRKSAIALSQLEKAQVHLMPNGKPTERVQGPMYYLARYGGAFLDTLYERFEVDLDRPPDAGR